MDNITKTIYKYRLNILFCSIIMISATIIEYVITKNLKLALCSILAYFILLIVAIIIYVTLETYRNKSQRKNY